MSSSKSDCSMEGIFCPICRQIPKPPISMCIKGHSICSTCLPNFPNCPKCQNGYLPQARNFLAEQLLQRWVRPCPWSSEGCLESPQALEWDNHLASCSFRPLICFLLQKETCSGTEINFHQYFAHLLKVHCVQGVKGAVINVTQVVTTPQEKLEVDMPRQMWPVQYLEACKATFLTGTGVREGKIFWWLGVIGDDALAEKYLVKITLSRKEKLLNLSWTGPVHSFRKEEETVLQEGLCLLATKETLFPYLCMVKESDGKNKAEKNSRRSWAITFSVMKKEKFLPKKNRKQASELPLPLPVSPKISSTKLIPPKVTISDADLVDSNQPNGDIPILSQTTTPNAPPRQKNPK